MFPRISHINTALYPSHIEKETHEFTEEPKASYMWGHIKGLFPREFKHEDDYRFEDIPDKLLEYIIATTNTTLLLIDRNFSSRTISPSDHTDTVLNDRFSVQLLKFRDTLKKKFVEFSDIEQVNYGQKKEFVQEIEIVVLGFKEVAFLIEDNELAAELIISEIRQLRVVLEEVKTSGTSVSEMATWRIMRLFQLCYTNFSQYQDVSEPTTTDLINKGNSYNFFAHEMRTPISSILLRQSMLNKGTDFAQGVAIDAIISALETIENLLGCLKDRDNMLERGTTTVDISESIIGFTSEWLQSSFKHLNIRTEMPDNPIYSNINIFGLRIALKELIRNAMKYSGGSNVVIRTALVSNMIEISVRDFGTVPLHEPTKVFDPGVRDGSNTSANSGTGMGLFGVSNYAHVHGGKVSFREILQHERKIGSMVTLSIPQY